MSFRITNLKKNYFFNETIFVYSMSETKIFSKHATQFCPFQMVQTFPEERLENNLSISTTKKALALV